jgi:polysaccharide export outer membrane protein
MKTMLIAALWLWAAAPAQPPAAVPLTASPAPSFAGNDYVIGPKDVIAVTVFNEEAMSRPSLTVDAEGTVDMPHIGRVLVGGLTARQVEDTLVKRYSGAYLINPSISVIVKEYRNMIVYVQGAVRNAGAVELKGNPTLLAALTEAGSLTSDAGSYIIITPAANGEEATGPTLPDARNAKNQTRIRREDVDNGLANNVRLRAGDTIFVPKADKFFVSGQVRTPGDYELTEGLNVLQALTLAGGTTDRAAKNRIKIKRLVNGTMKEISVKENDLVQPGDTILVPTRFW